MITQERKEEILKGLKEGTIINEDIYISFDKKGRWNRNYLDMSVPAEELALPRNEIEEALYLERVRLETGPILRSRLSCKNPMPLIEMFESYDPDYDDPDSEVVLESFKKTNVIAPYCVFIYRWQNRDWTTKTKEEKIRPIIVWDSDIKDQLLAIEVTSQSKKYRKYQVLIEEWESIGLTKRSWARIDNFDILDRDLIRRYIGKITLDTINEIHINIIKFNKQFGEDPWDLMYWLKSNQTKLYSLKTIRNEPLIIDYKRIKGSSTLTSFNMTYLFYKCAKKNKYKASIYWVTLYTSKNEKLSIFFSIFIAHGSKYGTIYTDPHYAGIITEQKLQQYHSMKDGIAEYIIKRLRKFNDIQTIYHSIYKFTDDDLKLIETGVYEKDILSKINN